MGLETVSVRRNAISESKYCLCNFSEGFYGGKPKLSLQSKFALQKTLRITNHPRLNLNFFQIMTIMQLIHCEIASLMIVCLNWFGEVSEGIHVQCVVGLFCVIHRASYVYTNLGIFF